MFCGNSFQKVDLLLCIHIYNYEAKHAMITLTMFKRVQASYIIYSWCDENDGL